MDWMNKGAASGEGAQTTPHGPAVSVPRGSKKDKQPSKAMRVVSVVLLVLAAVLIVLLAVFIMRGKTEGSYVKKGKLQAVFLNGGQVYFGKIKTLNKDYLSMDNIYYLRVNQQVQPKQGDKANTQNDISLVKLGCELHGPEDSMLINREQVIFWENLKEDGQVAKAVAKYIQDNPNGQKCESTSNTTNTTNTTGSTSGNNESGTTNP
jgi:hypothetical protein